MALKNKTGNSSTCTVENTPYALKGQKLLAQGIALGNYGFTQNRRPVRAKALKNQAIYKAFALTIIFALGKIKR